MDDAFTCQCCKRMYDLLAREPAILTCCGETICRECFHEKFEQGLGFKCLLCDSTDNVQLVINMLARTCVEQRLAPKAVKITCDVHEDSRANIYIKSVNKMVCMECLLSEYKDNVQESVFIESDRLDSYVKAAIK